MNNQRLSRAARVGACRHINNAWNRLKVIPPRIPAYEMVRRADNDVDLITGANILDELGFDLTNVNRLAVTYTHSDGLRIFLTCVNGRWEYRGGDDDPSHFRTYPIGTKFRQNVKRRIEERANQQAYFAKIDLMLIGTPYERRGGYNIYHRETGAHVSIQITDNGPEFYETTVRH